MIHLNSEHGIGKIIACESKCGGGETVRPAGGSWMSVTVFTSVETYANHNIMKFNLKSNYREESRSFAGFSITEELAWTNVQKASIHQEETLVTAHCCSLSSWGIPWRGLLGDFLVGRRGQLVTLSTPVDQLLQRT
ncbi:hypothetical protein E1B28_007819 [Marasmius oreades]|uniref:Uncharacterized protein n=1 Tax=Marasmius oreades TaxID=181124 RepID=A0A9P7S2N6_9AGAR|nr:uncharacterized protein E1B28_013882 [Marasmius oreades]XP_043010682.1 uncharacterized protein E1B28_007819 [Marasmius oreades]KAG7085285.1 hypothetical protein E1B28_013882 [Marasmius oreades]KAG7094212.1 hypothetical protein E1B28_007819 [Marasmius oreades]